MRINFKYLSDLFLRTFSNFVAIYVLLTLGFGFGRGITNGVANVGSEDVPFLLFVSLVIVGLVVIIDAILEMFDHDANDQSPAESRAETPTETSTP